MKKTEILATGLATAALATGCSGHESQPLEAHPDITNTGCSLQESRLRIYESIVKRQPLTTYAISAKGKDVFTGLDGQGPEIANPLVLVCKGSIKYLVGIDRGFVGTDPAKPEIFPAKDVNYTEVDSSHHQEKPISETKIGRYLIKVTVHDPGPAPYGGARGFVRGHKSYGIMP